MTGRRVTVFGAGNIGRGLIGWLFGRAGWEVVFVDISAELVDLLNSEGSYGVVEVGHGGRTTETIGRVSAGQRDRHRSGSARHRLGRCGVHRRGRRSARQGRARHRRRVAAARQQGRQRAGLRELRSQHGAATEPHVGEIERHPRRSGLPGNHGGPAGARLDRRGAGRRGGVPVRLQDRRGRLGRGTARGRRLRACPPTWYSTARRSSGW